MSLFDTVQFRKPETNNFDLSHDVKYSMDMGWLTPTLCMEMVPGDKFNIQSQNMVRMSPMLAPIMHQVDDFTHYFFVPNRLVWANWEDFIAPKTEGATPPAFPVMATSTFLKGSIADYLGVPTDVPVAGVSAIPFAAFQMIYNEFYRDQNLIAEVTSFPLLDGVQSAGRTNVLNTSRKRAWEHDYFTSALPWPQKGPAVTIPVGSPNDVPVELSAGGADIPGLFKYAASRAPVGGDVTGTTTGATGRLHVGLATDDAVYDPNGTLIAKTSDLEIEAVTINSLRRAEALQKWFEKMARGGSRYIEVIRAHFGVNSSDSRLQRPEYISGTKNRVVISEVLQTSTPSTTGVTPTGTMAGHGLGFGATKGCHYYAEEHGYIFAIRSILPRTSYQQGIPKHFLKKERESFFWPDFANIGEQEILNKELYADGTAADDVVFGYTPRYAEYKYMSGRVAGDFRGNLDFWHMGRKFATRPLLNESFVSADPTKRIFAVTSPTQQSLWCHTFHNIYAVRKMPKYGTPTLA